MGPFQRGSRARVILVLLVLTAVSLMTLDGRDVGPVGTMRSAAMAVLSPFRSAAEWVFSPVANVWNGITGYDELEDENAELRRRVAELEGDATEEQIAGSILARFLADAEISFTQDVERVTARVVAGPPSSFEATVTIDKGSDDGIRENMPVVTGAGLVGRVERVTSSESVVVLITDSRMRVGARLVSTGEVGRVEGRGVERSPVLEVSAGTELSEGEILHTSGLAGSLYPPDIPVGRVLEVGDAEAAAGEDDEGEIDEDDPTATTTGGGSVIPGLDPITPVRVEIEPAARLDRLSFLTVLLWEPTT